MLDLNTIADRMKREGYWPMYIALVRQLTVVERSPLILAGPMPAIEIAADREDTEKSGSHGWWLRNELPFLVGEPIEFIQAKEIAA